MSTLRPLIAFGVLASAFLPARADPFVLRDGDLVALAGNGLVEHDQFHGYLESALTRRHPGAGLRFRNLGWSGDTVRGGARTGGYQNPPGLDRLLRELRELKPTVLLLGYGMNESFAGDAGLAGFRAEYARLLDRLAPLKARLILLSPTPHEDLGRPYPDPAGHNADLRKYADAIKQLAADRKLAFVDLFGALQAAKQARPERVLTTNGIQLNEAGYAVAAAALEAQLGFAPYEWRVELDAAGKVAASAGTRLDGVTAADGLLRFQAHDALVSIDERPLLRVAGLPAGTHVLSVDGKEVHRASAADWQNGVRLEPTGQKLRQAIVRKGELNYRRYRPFNDHSRHWGFIGGDFKLYDQEIAEAEAAIADLRRPTVRTFELRAGGR